MGYLSGDVAMELVEKATVREGCDTTRDKRMRREEREESLSKAVTLMQQRGEIEGCMLLIEIMAVRNCEIIMSYLGEESTPYL